jgi:uncharacterized protein YceH (UPF0502 family)
MSALKKNMPSLEEITSTHRPRVFSALALVAAGNRPTRRNPYKLSRKEIHAALRNLIRQTKA